MTYRARVLAVGPAVVALVALVSVTANRTPSVMSRFGEGSSPVEARGFDRVGLVRDAIHDGLVRKDGGWWGRRSVRGQGERERRLQRLSSLSYVSGTHPVVQGGVTVLDRARASEGSNLYSSAHGPQAFLMDMSGTVLHTWSYDRDDVWPSLSDVDTERPRRYFRRVRLMENGDLLAIYEYTGIVRLDADSKLVWAHQGWNHHDIDVDREGRIYVLGRDIDESGRKGLDDHRASQPPQFVDDLRVYRENVTVLSPEGEVLDAIDLIDAFERSEYAGLLSLGRRGGRRGLRALLPWRRPAPANRNRPRDLLHPNTVEVFDGSLAHRSPLFGEGNLLVSLRNISTIAIIDQEKRAVVWAMADVWTLQHQPTLLPNGRMLVFDNFGRWTPDGEPAGSRVVEFDPLTGGSVWEYAGTDETPFFSSLMGSSQRLQNGNVLISESDFGRVFEVTPEKEIVWEFRSPHTSGPRDEFVAVIPELTRLSPNMARGLSSPLVSVPR